MKEKNGKKTLSQGGKKGKGIRNLAKEGMKLATKESNCGKSKGINPVNGEKN